LGQQDAYPLQTECLTLRKKWMLGLSNHAPGITYLILWAAVYWGDNYACLFPQSFPADSGSSGAWSGLDMSPVLCMGVSDVWRGEGVWFEAGRQWGSQIIRILCAFSSDPHYCAQRAPQVFGR